MDEPKVTISIPKRWLQFRLRSLLLLMLLVAIALPFVVDRPKRPAVVVAMDGYCPVTLTNAGKWTQGNPKYSETYDGLTYYFAGRVEQDKFFRYSKKYALPADGVDVVVAKKTGQPVPGSRRYGFRYDGRMYLFSSQASANEFAATPDNYAKFAAEWGGGH